MGAEELQISERWTFAASTMLSHYYYNHSAFGFQSRTKNSRLGCKLPTSNAADFSAISGGWKYNSFSPPPPPPSLRPTARSSALQLVRWEKHTQKEVFFVLGAGGRKQGERRVRLSVVALGCQVPERHHRQQQRPPPKTHRHCRSLPQNISKYERTSNRFVRW